MSMKTLPPKYAHVLGAGLVFGFILSSAMYALSGMIDHLKEIDEEVMDAREAVSRS